MENININSIPKGQKLVIRSRSNGDTELLIRPDVENGQLLFSGMNGCLGTLLFLGFLVLLLVWLSAG